MSVPPVCRNLHHQGDGMWRRGFEEVIGAAQSEALMMGLVPSEPSLPRPFPFSLLYPVRTQQEGGVYKPGNRICQPWVSDSPASRL